VKPKIAAEDLRVLRYRTFSKAYGMAGARIGYALGAQEIIMNFDKIRNHFGIGRMSQVSLDQPNLTSPYTSLLYCIPPRLAVL
jgi:histidinol-phosphate aminotransferase